MSQCSNKEENLKKCNCSYPGCPRKGICCECLHYHLPSGQVPACFFSNKDEATYNRSMDFFIAQYRKR